MNSIQFIQDYGVEKARKIINGQKDTVAPNLFKYFSPAIDDYHMMNIESNVRIEDLKRLVESVEIINGFNGVESVEVAIKRSGDKNKFFISFKGKEKSPEGWSIYFPVSIPRARKAIADYQAIYS